jgi:hypothetical protein
VAPHYNSILTSEAGVRGHVQACVLAYGLVRILEGRLDAAALKAAPTVRA